MRIIIMGKDEARAADSCSSSIDSSSSHPRPPFFATPSSSSSSSSSSLAAVSKNNQVTRSNKDLSTDLKLGLSISSISPPDVSPTSSRTLSEQKLFWPPIKPLLRSTLAERAADHQNQQQHHGCASLFVKVYLEGIPIGRKLDLLALEGYNALITTLRHMFSLSTTILCPHEHHHVDICDKHKQCHVLTYEDKEGDWMMVGDVPWEMFLTTVKRLKITRADRC